MAERRDAIGRRLRHDPGVGAIATVDHGKLRKGGNLTANERATLMPAGKPLPIYSGRRPREMVEIRAIWPPR